MSRSLYALDTPRAPHGYGSSRTPAPGSPRTVSRAGDEEIDDTLLHEIAHALVGKAHGHDQVWQAKAVALGCSGKRCHDVQFTPPCYIVTCDKACWVTTAERRTRGAVCRTCHGLVRYTTYTEERWQQARMGS